MVIISSRLFSDEVSYPAWDSGGAWRQETIRERFPIRREAEAEHGGGKLLAKSFLFGVRQWWSMAAGNYSRKVSYPAWDSGGACRRETIRERFPIRHGTAAEHDGRKLYAKGFLSGVRQWRSMTVGNYSQTVSCPAWDSGGAWRQETISGKFPIRRGTAAEHSSRKLLAKGFLFGVRQWQSMAAGNY